MPKWTGVGPGGFGGGGWQTSGGRSYTPQGPVQDNYWTSASQYTPRGSRYDQLVYNQQEAGRTPFNQTQGWLRDRDPDAWERMSQNLRENSPDYWQRWFAPFYGNDQQRILNSMYGGSNGTF